MRSGSSEPGKRTACNGKSGTLSRRPAAEKRLISSMPSVVRVAVAQYHGVLGAEALGERVRDVDRAVAPAGAADGDGDGGALVEHEARDPALQERLDVLHQQVGLRLALEELNHRGVVAGERAQLRVVVRVGQ